MLIDRLANWLGMSRMETAQELGCWILFAVIFFGCIFFGALLGGLPG